MPIKKRFGPLQEQETGDTQRSQQEHIHPRERRQLEYASQRREQKDGLQRKRQHCGDIQPCIFEHTDRKHAQHAATVIGEKNFKEDGKCECERACVFDGVPPAECKEEE